jgi:hypothetical protein
MNVTVFVWKGLGRTLLTGTDTDCFCDCWEGLAESNIKRI